MSDEPCLHCAITIALVQFDGGERRCACGEVYARPEIAPPVLSPVATPAPTPEPPATPPERPARRRSTKVYTAPDDAPAPALSPLERAARDARRPKPTDPELVRVQVLLADLRPDLSNPLEPPPREQATSHAPIVRVASDSWGGLPRGFGSGGLGAQLDAAAAMQLRTLVDVRAKLDAMPPDARAVLSWLRSHATLAAGLRGLYVDVGLAFASAEQSALWERNLTARRDGAHAHGRHLVLGAATVWGV